mmetsp:Transcript_120565/g.336389  ORF Transcript_120565/g.336389 Transcript_120565/m.336389 type:complete len:457 (+) Transcript_120565:86-1456(+)
MRTSWVLDESAIDSLMKPKARGRLAGLYRNVRDAISESRRRRHFDLLWERLAPTGNIYRYLGLRTEHLRNCVDLGQQLAELADQHRELLGGEGKAPAERAAELRRLLRSAQQQGLPNVGSDEENGEAITGFPPLEEFLDDATEKVGGLIIPKDAASRAQWRRNHFMALLICTVQVVAPALMFIQNWNKEENQLRDPRALLRRLNGREAVCLGRSAEAELTTLLGTLMLVVINSIILTYAQGEQENAQKLGRLPLDRFWTILGTLANASCCLILSFTIPLEFWSEEGTTGIIMNAMALLFIFSFDDLSCDAFGYLGMDDAQFQCVVSWHYSLLSQCPVKLADLIDPNASSAEELWQISYDAAGRLRVAASDAGPCATRVAPVQADEAAPLLDRGEEEPLPEATYQVSPGAPICHLPSWHTTVDRLIWAVVVSVLQVVWWVVPVVWFVVNKPCQDVQP